MLSMNMKWLSSLMILAEIAVVKPQGFENGPGTVNGLVNGSMVFSWNFDRGPNNVSTIRWFKDDTIFVLGIIIGGDQRKGPEYTDRMISYIEPYGFELSYLTQGDAGKYTCEIFAGSTLTSDAYLEMFYLDLPLEVVMEIEGNSSSDTIEVDAKVKVTVWAPYNDPPVVNISIGVSYDLMTNSDINCDNMNGTIPCIHEWTANEASDVVIKSCLAHPAVSVKVCKEAKFTVTDPNTLTSLAPGDTSVTEDPNTLTSSLAPDDTSVSTDTLPSTKDPTVTQPSSSPTVTASDDPQSGWSHWYILLIALGCLIILVVIAVVIHRRSQRKDDDLSPVTELKPLSVLADHARANTAGYRPSQQQHPRREDNTAYYVEGTSGARL